MKLTSLAVCLIVLGRIALGAQDLEMIDELWEMRDHVQGEDLIGNALRAAGSGAIRAELYWRQARLCVGLGDDLEDQGAPEEEILAQYLKGEASADAAIQADGANHNGYYWKSVNLGRSGQIRGILKSLAAAKPMRDLLEQAIDRMDRHSDSYYVMGQLYRELPGSISFGDKDAAVSLGRWAIVLMDEEIRSGDRPHINYDFYTELAKSLHARGSSPKKRDKIRAKARSQHDAATSALERAFYYEGVAEMHGDDDTEESEQILQRVLRELRAISNPTPKNTDDLKEAEEVLAEW